MPGVTIKGWHDDESKIIEGKRLRNINRKMLVNCWHINEDESMAMWQLYLKSNEGIAIQTTYGNLVDAFMETAVQYKGFVEIRRVDYKKYKPSEFYEKNPKNLTLHLLDGVTTKRKDYSHEKELRVIITPTEDIADDIELTELSPGTHEEVDLETLIQRVHICPLSPPWIKELVESVLEKYELCVNVEYAPHDEPNY